MRKQFVAVVMTVFSALSVGAQIPVMMVHGFASNGGTWSALNAALLGTKFTPYATDLPWQQPVTTQASALSTFMGNNGLGQNTYLVGHSMGGLTSRQASRIRLVSGVITIGTPHNGTGIATSFGSVTTKFGITATDYGTAHMLLDGFLQHASFEDPVYNFAAQGLGEMNVSYPLWLAAVAAANTLGYVAAPSLSDLSFGSSWRNYLNASEASFPLPHKFGIMCSLAGGYYGGPLALVRSPWEADNMGFNLQVNAALAAINGLSLILNHDDSSDLSMFDATIAGGALQQYGYELGTFSDWWTYTVVGGYPHDGVVPTASQQFPTTAAANVCNSPHTKETTDGVTTIVGLLNSWNP